MKRTAAVVLGIGLALGVTAPAAEARRKTPPKPTVSSSSAAPVVGRSFIMTGRAGGTKVARIVLQRKVVHRPWHTVAAKTLTRHVRKATWTRREGTARTVWYRTRFVARYSTAERVTVRRPPAPAPTLILSAGQTDGGDVYVGDVYTVGGQLTRGATAMSGVVLRVERRLGTSGTWESMGPYTTDSQGEFSLDDSSPRRGMVYYRATGGGRSAMTAMPVFEVLSMPAVAGPTLKMTYKPTTCDATIGGNDDAVTLGLREKAGCGTKAGDYVDVRWNPPGVCAPVRLDSFSLTGESSPTAEEVRVQVYLDDNPIFPDQWRRVQRGTSTGVFTTGSNEFDEIGIRMTVSEGSGDFVGEIANAEAQCL
jgi:hypothetical protein